MAAANTAATEDKTLGYEPATPVRLTHASVMSQDVVGTAEILVDATSISPVATFVNPSSGDAEALVISNVGGERQVFHVARDPTADGGWTLNSLVDGVVTAADEVAAGTAYSDTFDAALYGFFRSADGNVHVTQFDPQTCKWLAPTQLGDSGASNLKVAYSVHRHLVLYGSDANGDLFTAYQEQVGGGFTAAVSSVDGQLAGADFHLCMTEDDSTWALATNAGGKPVLYTGKLGASTYDGTEAMDEFQGTLDKIALGHWNSTAKSLVYLLVDDDHALHVWTDNSNNPGPVINPVANSNVVQATGQVDSDGYLHVYSVDDSADQRLWVLHQLPDWNDDWTPNWAPYIAVGKHIGGVVGDVNPADAPSLFAFHAADDSLRFHAQDPDTSMWKSGKVLQSAETSYDVVRFRTEINVVDNRGNSLPLQPVTVSVAAGHSATEIWAAGKTYSVSSGTETQLATDTTGKLTIAVLTTAGMVTPPLVVNTAGLEQPVTVQPSEPVHTYLSGQGTLNPTHPNGALPAFDAQGNTLSKATVGGAPLAPRATDSGLAATAASAIQNTALVGLGTPPAGVTGYKGTLSGTGKAEFTLFHDREELDSLMIRPAGLGDDISDFFGDIWEGIKNGVVAVVDFVVDIGTKIAQLTLDIAGAIKQGVQLALTGIEQAAHFIAGVFAALEAEVEKVIDWLKALFDFGAIWRTKMALEQALLQAPAYINQALKLGENAVDGWFASQKEQIDKAFEEIEARLDDQTFAGQQAWQPPGGGPSATPAVGAAAPSDFTTNVHHNWLHDKVSSYAPDDSLAPDDSFQDPWSDFVKRVGTSADDFLASLKDFGEAYKDTIDDPASFGTVALPELLKAVNKLIDAVLELCDALADAFFAIGMTVMDSLESMLATELQLGFLNTLWAWIAKSAGYESDSKLTIAALISLMAAFPSTVIYKLVEGVGNEPFPKGQFPGHSQGKALVEPMGIGIEMPFACVFLSAILQIVYFIPAAAGDVMGNAAPAWLTLISIGSSILIWVLANGYPDLTAVQWAELELAVAMLFSLSVIVAIVLEIAKGLISKAWAASADVADVGLSVYGVAKLGLGIWLDFLATTSDLQKVANILLPLPPVFSFLNLSAYRDDPETAPAAIAGNLLVDFIGYVGGGVVQAVGVLENRQAQLAPATV